MTFATADKNQLLLRAPAILPSVGISSYLKLGPIQYSFRDKLNNCNRTYMVTFSFFYGREI